MVTCIGILLNSFIRVLYPTDLAADPKKVPASTAKKPAEKTLWEFKEVFGIELTTSSKKVTASLSKDTSNAKQLYLLLACIPIGLTILQAIMMLTCYKYETPVILYKRGDEESKK